jgi:hypothetical protein
MIYLYNLNLQIRVDLEVIKKKTYTAMFTIFSCRTDAFANGYELYGQVYTWALIILCMVLVQCNYPLHVMLQERMEEVVLANKMFIV